MPLKYWTDEFGNMISAPAQRNPIDGGVLYNPNKETLNCPGAPPKGKRVFIKDGKFSFISIAKEHAYDDTLKMIRPKTERELMRDEIIPTPKGIKIVEVSKSDQAPDGLIFEPKSIEEQVADGEITKAEGDKIKLADCHSLRRNAYINESDGLFFDFQRGEGTKEAWLSAVAAIKSKFPKP